MKAYDTLVARKARMEERVIIDAPVEPTREDSEEIRLFDAIANIVHKWLFANGDGDKMVAASKRLLARVAQKCILLEKDPTTGRFYEVTGPPCRNRSYNRQGISD